MKRKTFLKTIIPALFLVACGITVSAQSVLKAGASKVNITPPFGTIINGDFLPFYTQEIHDSLYVKSLAFGSGKERFVFVVVDNMTVDGDLINDAKALILKNTGLQPGQVMVSSTHSHSCGSVIETATCQADLSYRLSLPAKIAESVRIALSKLQPVKIAWGHIDVPKHVACRRWFMKAGYPMVNPFGETERVWMNPEPGSEFLDHPVSPTDPQVSYLAVKTIAGKWISILGNYSTHYAGGIPENTISADYYGEMDIQLKAKLNAGDDFIGIMTNGTSGDVNTFDFRQTKHYPTGNFEKMKLIANDISDSILVSLKQASWDSKAALKHANAEVAVDRRQPSKELLAREKEIVRKTNYGSLGSIDKAGSDYSRLYALDVVKLDAYQPKTFQLPVQAISLGEGTIGTLPGEFFAETGLNLKQLASSKFYFSISLANAMIGYVPPAPQFQLGGYETWLCSGSCTEVGAEAKISGTLIGLIKSVQ